MKKTQFKLTNNIGEKIALSMEPEGTIVELTKGKSIIIELCSETNPVLDLQINKDKTGLYFSVWPERGGYEIIES
jgi:hypothetical protein